jgi:putative ABC transport system permease protein
MKRSLRSWLWRVPLEQEVDEEIAHHIELRIRELVERGMKPDTARELVLSRIGDLGQLKRTCVDLGRKRDRAMQWTRRFEDLRDDVLFALRQLKGSPAFALVAVVTLALGIGANSAMFAVADATLLRPLPFAKADRLVTVSELRANGTRGAANPLDVVDWIERNHTFDAMAGVINNQSAITWPDGTTESIPTQAVTTRFFDVLGITPIVGRTFLPSDERPMPDVAVLAEGLWRSRFGSDTTLIGRQTRLAGRMYTVIGVVPASFAFDVPGTASTALRSVWTLLSPPASRGPSERYPHYMSVIGRLKDGVTLDAARADMRAVSDAIAEETPATNTGHRATVDPLRDTMTSRDLRLTSFLLLGVVGFVLLMCCANVANLLLARTNARARELAVRSALGAGRTRIARQLLTEGVVLAALGGLLGAAVGASILSVAPSLVPPGLLPTTFSLGFDLRVLTFCSVTTIAVAVMYGLAPAWHATGMSFVHAMTAEGRSVTGGGSGLRRVLAMGQVAVAVLLLCGAGLLLRTLLTLENVDSGSRAGELLTMIVGGGGPGGSSTPESIWRNYAAYEREIAQLPGVRAVAWGTALPLDGGWYGQTFQIDGDPPRSQADRDGAGYQIVSPSYFRLLGIPVLDGRGFSESDTANGPQVCVVDEAFVRRYLRGRSPLGTRISINAMVQPPRAVMREIVGVVGQVKERPEEAEPQPHVYVPLAQNPWWSATLVVQPADGPAEALMDSVRAALARVNPDQPPARVRPLTAIANEATAKPRFRAVLVGAFATLSLILAVVGVFGVLAYSVQQRTREFGVRIALGASAANVLLLVMASAGRVIGTGVAIGLGAAALLSRSISAFLFGVQPLDPITFVLVPLVLIATATIAVTAPAWRAARVDPVVAFRAE